MCHYVGHEEGEEEPAGNIAIELAGFPDVADPDLLGECVFRVENEDDKEEEQDVTNRTPHDVWDEQALHLILQILLGVARDGLVEVPRLKEEEGHEKISPLHDGCPPILVAEATIVGDVEHDHADDADATQEVEGVIALFHVNYCFWGRGWISFQRDILSTLGSL